MSVDVHPSRAPAKPYKPPATSTTAGTINKMKEKDSGQPGVQYGFRHELSVTPGAGTERAHDFTNHGSGKGAHGSSSTKGSNEPMGGSMPKASRPGDEKSNDEPG